MRIISQNGKVDLPYEQVGVQINNLNKKDIIAYPMHVAGESHWTLAKYSTEEKAVKAMEMLRTEYGRHFFGKGGPMATANFYIPPLTFTPPKVFRFPQDSKV